MAAKVKICGVNCEAALEAALEAGADYVGLVFYPPSPRSVTPARAAVLAALARGRATIVALLVDPDDRLLDDVVGSVDPDLIQLHGKETPARVAEIRSRSGRPVMKAISVATRSDAEAALAYAGVADLLLFDAKAPEDLAGALPGGNGLAFDWHVIEGVRDKVRFVLSGGLTPANVAEAIRQTGADIVDVSSGVESRPGEKDPRLIHRFLAAAKSVEARAGATEATTESH